MSATLPEAAPASALLGAANRRIIAIAAILLALLVPHWLIADLIGEREARSEGVKREIGNSWGQPQTAMGPVLVVPWRAPVSRDANGVMVHRRGAVAVLPTELRAEAALAPETRRRGLFEATVYAARLGFTGRFTVPEVVVPDVPEAELLWAEAHLLAGSTELRPAGLAPPIRMDGRVIEAGEAEYEHALCGPQEALRWPLGLDGPPARPIAVELEMDLRGSSGLHLVPLARRAGIAVSGSWATPSFAGAELPVRSQVEADRFEAAWDTGTRLPLVRRSLGVCRTSGTPNTVGVELLEAVPTYRMVSRASKYTFFILALTFVTVGIFETLAKLRLHPVQYGLLGASVVLFPLLLLAVGEPLGFGIAYAVSAAAVVAQASAYTAATTGRWAVGAGMAAVLAALFAFLHVVLSLESYALLAGTLALFLALSVVMAVTRRVRWAA